MIRTLQRREVPGRVLAHPGATMPANVVESANRGSGGAGTPDDNQRFTGNFGGNTPEAGSDTQFGENPDQPLGRIPLPRFHTIAVIVLKFVVIVVVALPEGEDREKE